MASFSRQKRSVQQLLRLCGANSASWHQPLSDSLGQGFAAASAGGASWSARLVALTGSRCNCNQLRSAASQAAAAAAAGVVARAGGSRAARPSSLSRRMRVLLHDYRQLSKAKLSLLVALTASAGFAAGSEETIDWARLAWTSLGTFGAAACANTLNQVYEVANDARMSRTCNRPLPAGRLGVPHALAFAAASGAAGLWLLWSETNGLTTALGAANIILYSGVYTPLKQLTVANTWVGAVVGAVPPLMGWAAAAGCLEPGAWVLAGALFSWQMPHFLALAWLCKEDYARGGFRMLSNIDPSGVRTAGAALRHCAYLLPAGAAAVLLGVATPAFAAEAALLAVVMGAGAARFLAAPSQASARSLFRTSLLYLPLLLLGLAVHRQPNSHASWEDVRERAAREWGVALPAAPQLPTLPTGGVSGALDAVRGVLPELRLRPVEERLAFVVQLQRQMQQQGIKCPSRVYADEAQVAMQLEVAVEGADCHGVGGAGAAPAEGGDQEGAGADVQQRVQQQLQQQRSWLWQHWRQQ